MINLYAGLSQLRTYFDFNDTEGSATNTDLRSFLSKASRIIDGRTHRQFYPSEKELFFNLPRVRTELRWNDWEVFEILQLADYNGGSIIPSSIIFPLCGTSYDMTPFTRLILSSKSGSSLNSSFPEKAVKLTGSIGFTEDWKDPYSGWVDSNSDLSASGLTTTAMSALPITGGSGDVNVLGDWPTFYGDQIIRVKSGSVQEIMMVVDTNLGGSTLGVLRGQNGTGASIWGSGISIETWYPPQQIVQATVRLASWLYESRSNPQGGRTIMPSIGQIILQDNIPEDVTDTINNYTKFSMGTEFD